MTRADVLVIRVLFCVIVVSAAVVLLTGCSSDEPDGGLVGVTIKAPDEAKDTTLTFHFSPYDQQPLTRAATSIEGIVTRLDVWIYTGGEEVTAVHQNKDDDGFGSVSLTLDKTKTYTMYAMGHRCSGAATLSNGIVSFPDEKVTHAMFYSETFSPSNAEAPSCLMERIVGAFTLTTTDVVPEEVTTMRFGISASPTRWNVAGYGVNSQERTTTFSNFSRRQDGTATFSVYAIADTDEPVDHDITVTALDSDGETIQTRMFSDVPIRNGYRTTYSGAFFIDADVSTAFTVDDWQDLDVVEF